jgi:hypothetical protein
MAQARRSGTRQTVQENINQAANPGTKGNGPH